jgi:hypothetical protein
VLALGTAERLSVLLHQRLEDLLPDADEQIEQSALRIGQCPEHRQRKLNRDRPWRLDDLEMRRGTGMLGHGGSFLLVGTTSVPHGGGRSRRSQSLRSSSPTASGTSPTGGHITVKLATTPDHLIESHRYTDGFDQTFLPQIITACKRILERFPVREPEGLPA